MKYIFIFVVVFSCVKIFAEGMFGIATAKTFGTGQDQSKCTAQRLIENAVQDTGVDIVDGQVQKTWDCSKGETSGVSSSRCPSEKNMHAQKYKCFSNTQAGYPYICVADAKSEDVAERYEKKATIVPRPRFSEMFVAQSKDKARTITMDADGCAAKEVTGSDSTAWSEKTCAALLRAALNGGSMSPGQDSDYKFCDVKNPQSSDYAQAFLRKTKDLNHCFEAFPNLPDLVKETSLGGYRTKKTPEIQDHNWHGER